MFKLSEVAVYPSPIERQKVSLCLKVFCDETVCALKCHSEMQHAKDTVVFIEKVLQFWHIVNVKSPHEDICMGDKDRAVIRSENDEQLKTLQEFGDMALKMCKSGTIVERAKCFTKDTSKAIWHSCNGLVGLSKHLLKTSHQYVLLGIFTTDHLEKQFGKLRQGCGGTYFITVQQIMEKMAIQKTKICLRFDDGSLLNTTDNHGHSVHACDKCSFIVTENMCTIIDNLYQNLKITYPWKLKLLLSILLGT